MQGKRQRKRDRAKELEFNERHTYTRNVPTPDDWYPPVIIDGAWFVRGTVFMEKGSGPEPKHWVRICFWGDDDMGLEKDQFFPPGQLEEALQCYHKACAWLQKLAFASHRDLKKLGFVAA